MKSLRAWYPRMRWLWAESETPAQAVRGIVADKVSRIIGASVLAVLLLLILSASSGGNGSGDAGYGGPQHRVYGPTVDHASNGTVTHSDLAGVSVYTTSD
jgi:hypothetical protein